jgi:hypothetical protein
MAIPRLAFCNLAYLSGWERFNVKEDKTAWVAVGSPALAVTPGTVGAELGPAGAAPCPEAAPGPQAPRQLHLRGLRLARNRTIRQEFVL